MRVVGLIVSFLFVCARLGISAESGAPDWSMNASIIEACSCPMFCQCYFNDKPAGHGEHAGHSHGEGYVCKPALVGCGQIGFNQFVVAENLKRWAVISIAR